MDPAELAARLRELEERMHRHARDLEFEEAAKCRDEIHRLRAQGLMA
ncbi:MAG TPA: UvrB/UvrC motif-containing protein [Arenimonas sp.]|nr:UvrB/UvrC motif-containing protein [Arenimonas sp.]